MLVESICIILILAIMVIVFLRAKRKDFALATAPLLIVPLFHTLSNILGDLLHIALSVNIKAAADVVGLSIAVAAIGFISAAMSTKKSRLAYIVVAGGFTAVITIIFIFNYYA